MKLKLLIKLLFAKKYVVITGSETLNIVTTYPDSEITKSGNAIYIHTIKNAQRVA